MARDGGDTLWLSVGVFDSCPPLERALAELLQDGFSNRDMCLLGTSAAFADMVRRPNGPLMPRSGRPLYQRQRHMLPWLSEHVEVLATSGILLRTLVAQATAEQETPGAPTNLIQELCNTLNEHLKQDAIVLLVTATDHNQQNQGSRVLLRHSFHTVQTYAVPTNRARSVADA
jgi:hypothetical protein